MSSKPRKGSPTKKTGKGRSAERPMRPAGKTPEAMVTARHGQGDVVRLAKGFSNGELMGASIPPRLASTWGVKLDVRRRSVLQGNVDSLKAWTSHGGTGRPAEARVKELEEEVEKVEKAVKKEAAKVEKKVVKVEKEAKEEAAKVEKAVKRRTQKPKKKSKKSDE